LWNPSLLVEIMDRAIRSHLDAKASATAARDWLRAALHLLAEEDKRIQQVGSEATHAANIQRICESICLHPGLPHRVADLARQAHCCPGHFARLFKAHTGVTPREFITKTRIDAAQGLLRMSGHTIAEIADELGYCDVAHFSRQFRQRTGYSPSDYRHEWPAKRVAPS
jgi:AraC-like DNA-binding protein